MRKLNFFVLSLVCTAQSWAANLDTIGVTLLRTMDSSLQGSGVSVVHPEPPLSTNLPPAFEVNPVTVGQPASLFTYLSAQGTAATFPNSVGMESWHANWVGSNFYGVAGGVAPQVSHVDNYEAGHYYDTVVEAGASIPGRVVNQSFIFPNLATNQQKQFDAVYDNYARQHNVLFISGAGNGAGSGNGGFINAPATSYNGIGVAVTDGASSIGPTRENGRCKPDITAPGSATSFSAPYVAGSAAVLIQAALRGDGGGVTTTNSAADMRTIKALLLNGAVKPANWTNAITKPLDARYGAGVVNVFNSHQQMTGGRHSRIESTVGSLGGAHPPGSSTNNIASLVGWDFNTINTTVMQERANHYYFDVSGSNAPLTLTATLVWNRQATTTLAPTPSLNNLDLFVFNVANGNLVAASTSVVDNVEHIFLPQLPPGRYDLQVLKRGGLNQESTSETYALVFELFSLPLTIEQIGSDALVSWPIAPAGFRLQSTASLHPPVLWSNVNASLTLTNHQNWASLPATNLSRFFRLIRP